MENLKKSWSETHRLQEEPESSPASQREKDIKRVYELLQSRRPLGEVLDVAISSIGKIQHCSERLADTSLSTFPECPQAPAPNHGEIHPSVGEIGPPRDEPNSTSAKPLPAQPRQLSHRYGSVRPVGLILITAIVAATIGVGILSRSGMYRATHVSGYSALDLPSTVPAANPVSNSAPVDQTVPVVAAIFEVPVRDVALATRAPEVIRDELHTISPDLSLLLRRGDWLLAAGDVASARLFYERAASAGDAQGALKLAETYDPTFLTLINSIGARGDVTIAKRWYRRAAKLGASEAEILLKSVGEH